MFCSQIFPFLSVWIFWTFKVLERISSISTYNVVHAGAWDQSKRDMHFFRVLKPHGLFFFFFFPLKLRGCYWKQQPEVWKLDVIGSLFTKKGKIKFQEHAAWAKSWNPVGVSLRFWEIFLSMTFERPRTWYSLLPIKEIFPIAKIFYAF